METMKTEKPKSTLPAPPKAVNPVVAELAAMDGIPVFELRFCVQGGRDLPLLDSAGGMGVLRARADRTITYLPKMQLHRVVQTSRDPQIPTLTFYIPREWATFQPLEG